MQNLLLTLALFFDVVRSNESLVIIPRYNVAPRSISLETLIWYKFFCAYWLLSPGIPCLWKTIQLKVVCHTWPWARHSLRRIPWPSFHRWQHWRIASRHKRDTRDTTVAFICHHISSSDTGTNVYRKHEKGFQCSALACSWSWDSSLLNHSEYFMLSPHLTKGCHGIMWHPKPSKPSKPSFVRFWCRCPSPPVPPRLFGLFLLCSRGFHGFRGLWVKHIGFWWHLTSPTPGNLRAHKMPGIRNAVWKRSPQELGSALRFKTRI